MAFTPSNTLAGKVPILQTDTQRDRSRSWGSFGIVGDLLAFVGAAHIGGYI